MAPMPFEMNTFVLCAFNFGSGDRAQRRMMGTRNDGDAISMDGLEDAFLVFFIVRMSCLGCSIRSSFGFFTEYGVNTTMV